MSFALLRSHLVEQDVGTLELDALEMIESPHIFIVEEHMGLRDQSLAIRTHKALVNHHIGDIPAVIAGFPLALTNQATHSRSWATLILSTERDSIGPVAGLGAVGTHLTIDGIHDGIF